MQKAKGSIARRLVLGAGLWMAAALSAGGFVLAGLFGDHVERSFDARLSAVLDGQRTYSRFKMRFRAASRELCAVRYIAKS